MRHFARFIFFFFGIFIINSCHDRYTPKKREFQRIDLPKKEYSIFKSPCGWSFELPKYAVLIPDTSSKASERCWYNLHFPEFHATLHLSYKEFTSSESLIPLIDDQRTLVYKHTIKADEISESPFRLKSGNEGIIYELFGNTATWYQFYITNHKNKFMRASLYFNTRTEMDSVAPVFYFLRADAEHIIQTLQWE